MSFFETLMALFVRDAVARPRDNRSASERLFELAQLEARTDQFLLAKADDGLQRYGEIIPKVEYWVDDLRTAAANEYRPDRPYVAENGETDGLWYDHLTVIKTLFRSFSLMGGAYEGPMHLPWGFNEVPAQALSAYIAAADALQAGRYGDARASLADGDARWVDFLAQLDRIVEARSPSAERQPAPSLSLMRDLSRMRDEGLITDGEFARKKTELLDRM